MVSFARLQTSHVQAYTLDIKPAAIPSQRNISRSPVQDVQYAGARNGMIAPALLYIPPPLPAPLPDPTQGFKCMGLCFVVDVFSCASTTTVGLYSL